MSFSFVLDGIVVEFPENKYVLNLNKSDTTDYEHASLISCHKQTATHLFRWFRNMKSSSNSENCSENLEAMIAVYRLFSLEMFASLREYVLVEGIVETSYRLQLQDSDLICQILNLLYVSWISFGPLHFKAILGRQRKNLDKSIPDFLPFFLEHARRMRLKYDGARMVDVSLYSCVRKSAVFLAADVWSWKHLLTYLQYGARFERLYQDPSKSQYGISSPLTETLRTLIRHIWFRLVSPANFLSSSDRDAVLKYCMNLDADVKNLCRTFTILLRAARRIRPGSLEYTIRDFDNQRVILLIPSRSVMTHSSVSIMIPMLSKRYGSPDELKHICRWTVRKRLNENWQLPDGIRSLQIPKKLQRYLNLLSD